MAVIADVTPSQSQVAEFVKKMRQEVPGKVPDRIIAVAALAGARVAAKRASTPGYRFTDKSGRLRKTIKAVRGKVKKGSRFVFAAVEMGGEDARQAVLIEFGTVKMKARAPLLNAIDETENQRRAEFFRVANRELRKVAKEFKSGKIRPVTRRALAADV